MKTKSVSEIKSVLVRDKEFVVGHFPTYTLPDSWEHVIDGIPVTPKLFQYANNLRKVMPNVKFAHSDNLAASDKGVSEVWVYYPNQEYALGYIGHGVYAVKNKYEADPVYIVYSRKVKNQKIHDNRPQHHMLQTEKVDRAVKNASKVLLPYTNQEIAEASIYDFSQSIREVVHDAEREASGYIKRCGSYDVLEPEMRNLISLGVKFVTAEFQAAATQFLTAEAELRAKQSRLKGAYFLRVYEKFGSTHVDILTYDSKIRAVSKYGSPKFIVPLSTTTLKMEDVPSDIQMKVATLSMMDDETYVPMVGMRVTPTSYWVEREGEE